MFDKQTPHQILFLKRRKCVSSYLSWSVAWINFHIFLQCQYFQSYKNATVLNTYHESKFFLESTVSLSFIFFFFSKTFEDHFLFSIYFLRLLFRIVSRFPVWSLLLPQESRATLVSTCGTARGARLGGRGVHLVGAEASLASYVFLIGRAG